MKPNPKTSKIQPLPHFPLQVLLPCQGSVPCHHLNMWQCNTYIYILCELLTKQTFMNGISHVNFFTSERIDNFLGLKIRENPSPKGYQFLPQVFRLRSLCRTPEFQPNLLLPIIVKTEIQRSKSKQPTYCLSFKSLGKRCQERLHLLKVFFLISRTFTNTKRSSYGFSLLWGSLLLTTRRHHSVFANIRISLEVANVVAAMRERQVLKGREQEEEGGAWWAQNCQKPPPPRSVSDQARSDSDCFWFYFFCHFFATKRNKTQTTPLQLSPFIAIHLHVYLWLSETPSPFRLSWGQGT